MQKPEMVFRGLARSSLRRIPGIWSVPAAGSAGVLPFVPNEQKSPPILEQVLPVEATAHPS
jgi:hypothetical protein